MDKNNENTKSYAIRTINLIAKRTYFSDVTAVGGAILCSFFFIKYTALLLIRSQYLWAIFFYPFHVKCYPTTSFNS